MKKFFINFNRFLIAVTEKQISLMGNIICGVWVPLKLMGFDILSKIDLGDLYVLVFAYSSITLLMLDHKQNKQNHRRYYKFRLTRRFNNEIKH